MWLSLFLLVLGGDDNVSVLKQLRGYIQQNHTSHIQFFILDKFVSYGKNATLLSISNVT